MDNARARATSTGAELAAAHADERAATERVHAARALLADEGRASGTAKVLTVTAPVAGRVLKRPVESAMPRPGSPSQPRKKPVSCHMPSRPRQPCMIGLPRK